jgi:hypothetical protein
VVVQEVWRKVLRRLLLRKITAPEIRNFSLHSEYPASFREDAFRPARGLCPLSLRFSSVLLLGIVIVMPAMGISAADTASSAQEASCLSCHADKTALKSRSPRWRDVYVDPNQFARDKHGTVDCTACHGIDRYAAFPHNNAPGALRDPADPTRIKGTCGKCHESITTRHLSSLHSTLEGHRSSLVSLLGKEAGLARFKTCTSCHTTCTHCHMKQPDRYNRLVSRVESHQFIRRPASAVCKVCHGQTAETYLGSKDNKAHGPSIMAAAGLECVDCHSEGEVHGSGKLDRFIGETLKPSCEKCHALSGMTVSTARGKVAVRQYNPENPAHRAHEKTVACVACHTQWYTNCWDCHKGKAREETDKFYLALNPKSGKAHTAIHVPINRDLGGVHPETGGWAVKTRHSWGKSQTCEKCHLDPEVYINPELRRASFVSFWSGDEAKASFVNDKLVKQVTIDREKFRRSAHKDLSCEVCHDSPGDEVCTHCHAVKGRKPQSRASFREADELLRAGKGLLQELGKLQPDVRLWEKQWTDLRDRYMEAANEFHGEPGLARDRMPAVRQASEQLKQEIEKELSKAKAQGTGRTGLMIPGAGTK